MGDNPDIFLFCVCVSWVDEGVRVWIINLHECVERCGLVFNVHLLLFSLSACSHLYLVSLLLFFFLLSFWYSFSYIPHLCPSLCIFPAPLSWRPFYLPLLSILTPQEKNAVIFLLLPKPQLENIGLIKVKGKGLKRKVFHASCEWYAGTENGKVPSFLFVFFPPPSVLLLQCSLCCNIVTAPRWVSSRDEVSNLSVD